jgi:coenzyme F420-reducing hydrogenase delta subunit
MNGEIVAFCCEHSAYLAADAAGKQGLHYPENLRIIRVPCAGRVDIIHILKAVEENAAAILVLGCEDGLCQHLTGNVRARERVKYSEALLKEVGVDGRRVGMFNLAANAPHKFIKIINEMNERIKEQGEAK